MRTKLLSAAACAAAIAMVAIYSTNGIASTQGQFGGIPVVAQLQNDTGIPVVVSADAGEKPQATAVSSGALAPPNEGGARISGATTPQTCGEATCLAAAQSMEVSVVRASSVAGDDAVDAFQH